MSGSVPVPDPPVWAPMLGFPAAFVPFALLGIRTWDKDGPDQTPVLLLPLAWVIYRRRGARLVRVEPP